MGTKDYMMELPIDEDHLMEELKDQHLRFARWGSIYARACKDTRQGKILLAKLEAELRDQVRKQLIEEGTRPTEGLLNEKLNLDPGYLKKKIEVARLEHEEEESKNARDAMRMRKDILLEMCRYLGQEVLNTYERMARKLDGRKAKLPYPDRQIAK